VPLYTQVYPADVDRFMRFMGVGSESWTEHPAMLPSINVSVTDPLADGFEQSLQKLKIDGKPLRFSRAPGGFFSLHFGHKNLHATPKIALLRDRTVSFEELGLECRNVEDQTDSTGYHVKSGMLLVYDPAGESQENSHRQQLSTLEIAPALLRNYSLRVPPYMKLGSPLVAN
jgi:hypothetical protein